MFPDFFSGPLFILIILLSLLVPIMLLLRCIRFFLFSVCAIQILIFAWLRSIWLYLFVVYGFPFLVPFSLNLIYVFLLSFLYKLSGVCRFISRSYSACILLALRFHVYLFYPWFCLRLINCNVCSSRSLRISRFCL